MSEAKLPNERDVANALQYLAETDEEYAKAKAWAKEVEKREKVILAVGFESCPKKGAEIGKQYSFTTPEYREWIKENHDANYDAYIIAAKRRRAEYVIEVWRSINANRRQGNI